MSSLRLWLVWQVLVWTCMAGNDSSTETRRTESGTLALPGLAESGLKHFSTTSPLPCTDCWITKAEVQLTSADTGEIIDQSEAFLDHAVFFNTGRKDGTCPERFEGERFLVFGREMTQMNLRTSVDVIKRGYRVLPDDTAVITGRLVNTGWQSRRVSLSVVWEFIPNDGNIDVEHATPYWLDIGGCTSSTAPSRMSTMISFESPQYRIQDAGEIIAAICHIRQGDTKLAIRHNNQIICELGTTHNTPSGAYSPSVVDPDELAPMSSCVQTVSMARNDTLQLVAHYDSPIQLPTSDIGQGFESRRGIALVYLAEGSSSLSGGLLRQESDYTEWWVLTGLLVLLSVATLAILVSLKLGTFRRLVSNGLRL